MKPKSLYPHHQNRDGIIVCGKRIRFTNSDRDLYARHFARVAIALKDIKTTDDFDSAWEKTRPFLFEHFRDIAHRAIKRSRTKSKSTQLEAQALMAIVEGDYEKSKHLLSKSKQMSHLENSN